MDVSQPSDVGTGRAAAAGAFDSFFLGLGVGSSGSPAAFDRAMRAARPSRTEALRTD